MEGRDIYITLIIKSKTQPSRDKFLSAFLGKFAKRAKIKKEQFHFFSGYFQAKTLKLFLFLQNPYGKNKSCNFQRKLLICENKSMQNAAKVGLAKKSWKFNFKFEWPP